MPLRERWGREVVVWGVVVNMVGTGGWVEGVEGERDRDIYKTNAGLYNMSGCSCRGSCLRCLRCLWSESGR